jgi:hypothetical protein
VTALQSAFLAQVNACTALGSPFMGQLMGLLARHWPDNTGLARRFALWPGDVSAFGASLPLRLAGGLHALVITGRDAGLSAAYPPNEVSDAVLLDAVHTAMRRHDAFLSDWVERPPQTNEVRRSAVLIAAAHWLTARYTLPLRLSELGASAGLNLMFDHFALDIGGDFWGPAGAAVRLQPDWRGPLPPQAPPQIADRRGVDLNPLQIGSPQDELRLLSYLWPDQTERMARTRTAMALAAAPVDKADAIDWLATRLATPWQGQLHVIYHTIAWQYFPADKQAIGRDLIVTAGAAATADAPLAWLALEADDTSTGAGVTLRRWPDDVSIQLGRAGFHGEWVEWAAPPTNAILAHAHGNR